MMLLRCSACAAELEGLGNDVIFLCRNCGRAWVMEDTLLPVPVTFVARLDRPGDRTARTGSRAVVHLPFWKVSCRLTIHERVSRRRRSTERFALDAFRSEKGLVRTSFPETDETYVFPAFSCSRALSVGVVLHSSPPSLLAEDDHVLGDYPALVGGIVSREDARSLSRAVAVGVEIDREDFLAGIDLDLDISGEELLGVPCVLSTHGFGLPSNGPVIPFSSMEDVKDILAFNSVVIPGVESADSDDS